MCWNGIKWAELAQKQISKFLEVWSGFWRVQCQEKSLNIFEQFYKHMAATFTFTSTTTIASSIYTPKVGQGTSTRIYSVDCNSQLVLSRSSHNKRSLRRQHGLSSRLLSWSILLPCRVVYTVHPFQGGKRKGRLDHLKKQACSHQKKHVCCSLEKWRGKESRKS